MNYPSVNYDLTVMQGGLDQVTPTLTLPSGFCRKATNFEASINGGYTRISGYERRDGRAKPSDAAYIVLICSLTGAILVGDTVTGATSFATGKVIAVSGSSVVITRQTGTFTTESILVSAVSKGTITQVSGAVANGRVSAEYTALSADEYRASITEVPGSGPILGGCYFNNKNYVFRNNAGGTAAAMYMESSSGWTLVEFDSEVSFSNANVNVQELDTLTQGGASASVYRVIVESGTLASGVNSGRLIINVTAGTFAAGAASTTGGGSLTLSGADSQISLLPNGNFKCVVANFGASDSSKAMYGCDGVNRGFEFDGTNFVPIRTGMILDAPDLLAVHKQHLFFSFGYSLQFSGIGDPFNWNPIVGAGEIAMLDDITNIIAMPGDQTSGALGVFTKSDTSILYGTSSGTFSLTTYNNGAGAIALTTQNLEQTYFLGNYGVMSMATTKDFGNFASSSMTMNIRPYITSRIDLTTGSSVQRQKGQYRLFFSDGTGVYLTVINGRHIGSMPIEFPNPVTAIWEGEDKYGKSTSFFGSSNGMMYEMDLGTSFDGAEIHASLGMVFNSSKSSRVLKRYRKASIECSGGSYISFDVGYVLGYSSDEIEQQTQTQQLRSSYWDSFIWDTFVWDGSDIQPTEIDLTGSSVNIAFQISSATNMLEPFTINAITTHYTSRRGIR